MDLRRKSSIKTYGSNKSSRSGSFDFDQDKDRDGDRREVVVKIDGGGQASFAPNSIHSLSNKKISNELQAAAMPRKPGPVPKSERLTTAASRRGGVSKQLQRQKTDRHFDEGITIDQLHRLSQKNISAWSMKRLMKIVRYGALTTMDEQIKHATGEEDELATQIHSEYEAKVVAAKRIFHNVAKLGSKHIYLSDLMRFMGQEEALKAMDLFEGAQEHSRVSKRSLKNWVVNAFRERKALALTLNDTKTAVNKLHQMANVDIEYRMLPLDINVRNAPTIQSTRMPTTWTMYS